MQGCGELRGRVVIAHCGSSCQELSHPRVFFSPLPALSHPLVTAICLPFPSVYVRVGAKKALTQPRDKLAALLNPVEFFEKQGGKKWVSGGSVVVSLTDRGRLTKILFYPGIFWYAWRDVFHDATIRKLYFVGDFIQVPRRRERLTMYQEIYCRYCWCSGP